MAGHYFYDPRPFYGYNGSNGLMPLDELFYGRYEPTVPYWMDQRMAPMSTTSNFGDYDHPGYKQMRAMPQMQQQYAYKRPESRDDIGVDMYRRAPYNFHGVAAAPTSGSTYQGGHHHHQLQSQDDTWVHAMSNSHGHGPMTRNSGNDQYVMPKYGNNTNVGNRGIESMPMSNLNTHMSNNVSSKGINNMSYNNMGTNMGNNGNKQMSASSNHKSTGFGSNGYHGNNGYENASKGGHGGKSMSTSKHEESNATKQRYVHRQGDDSSSDDSDDEYENQKWSDTKNSVKTASKGNNHNNNYHGAYDHSVSSQHKMSTKFGSHSKSGRSHGSKSSSKLALRFQGGDSSSSDSEDGGSYSHGHSKKSSSKGSSTKMSNHGSNHGSFPNHHHGHQQQSKQMQYGSFQSKGVELKVPICCDNCERKVKECLEYMDGVENVLCDQWNRKVIVYGNVKPESVLKRVRRVKKASELWQSAKHQQQQLQMRVY